MGGSPGWTRKGVEVLTLWLHGDPNNAAVYSQTSTYTNAPVLDPTSEGPKVKFPRSTQPGKSRYFSAHEEGDLWHSCRFETAVVLFTKVVPFMSFSKSLHSVFCDPILVRSSLDKRTDSHFAENHRTGLRGIHYCFFPGTAATLGLSSIVIVYGLLSIFNPVPQGVLAKVSP